jgi:hypothetical protein
MLGHRFADFHSTNLDDGKVNRITAVLKIWLTHDISMSYTGGSTCHEIHASIICFTKPRRKFFLAYAV